MMAVYFSHGLLSKPLYSTCQHNSIICHILKFRFDLILITFLVFNATFNNISAISWRPVLVMEDSGEPPTMGKQLVINK
jgi:hypothetical protein